MPAACSAASQAAGHRRHVAIKPTSSMRLPGRSIDLNGQPIEVVTTVATTPASASAPPPSPRR